MTQSKLFRFVFGATVASITLGVICFIIFPFSDCNYRACYMYFPNPYQCQAYGRQYCCNGNYSSYRCGDLSYCWPLFNNPCIGWLIAGSALLVAGGLFAFSTFVMFCNFKNRIKNGTGYLNMPVQPYYQHPVVNFPLQANLSRTQDQQAQQAQPQPQQENGRRLINETINEQQ